MSLSDGTATLTAEPRELAALRPHPRNYRRHPERQLALLRESLRVHGQQKPVVITPDGTILAGHGLVEAAGAEGWTQIGVHVYDGPYPEAFLAIDNRSSDLAEDDETALAELLRDLDAAGSLTAAGYGEDDLSELLARLDAEDKRGRDERFSEQDAIQAAQSKPSRVKTGEIWQLGRHRLLCGDSTNPEDVRRLMAGQRATLFATDPPYLVNYDGTNHLSSGGDAANKDWSATYIEPNWDDEKKGEQFYLDFCRVAIQEAITEDAAWYCWHASRRQAMLEKVWNEVGAFAHQQIIWVKTRQVLTRSVYLWQHEPCLFGWIRGKKPHLNHGPGGDWGSTIWHIPSSEVECDEHPTSKPVRVFTIPVELHTRPGAVCYEPFCGSGSQIIAGEQTGRAVYAMEQEPVYCEVTIARWEAFTGEQGVKVDA
jgi:DNA modification methylase